MNDAGPRLRVGTYNIYLGADLSILLGPRDDAELDRHRAEVQRQLLTTAFPSRARAVARVVAGRRLDLVGLQEACLWEADGRALWDHTALLLEALDGLGEPYEVVATQPTFRGSGSVVLDGRELGLQLTGSNTILRRVGSQVRVRAVRTGMFGNALRTTFGDLEVAIERGWCAVECALGEQRTLTFVDTHTEAYDETSRDTQRDELLAALPAGPEPVVVVGDFNATPDRVGMPGAYVDAWVAAGHPASGPGTGTCCQAPDLSNAASTLAERIDYVWVRGLEVLACDRIGAEPADRAENGLWPSDHAGVAAELGWPRR
jgi:endonuclease/exonuclease/phosphatase family metal-dependent hydrolase